MTLHCPIDSFNSNNTNFAMPESLSMLCSTHRIKAMWATSGSHGTHISTPDGNSKIV